MTDQESVENAIVSVHEHNDLLTQEMTKIIHPISP